MENPRPEKVAVVDEVREKLSGADAAVVTEYRGLNVAAMATLRRSLRDAGGDYKIYKNTLVRFAVRDLGLDGAEELLTGPTAIAFVTTRPDGGPADPVTVAKALRDFARTNPALVVKGGLLGDRLLSAEDVRALADVAPREELLARLAGGFAAPLRQFAGLLEAVPRSFAYGLKALIDQRGGPEAAAEPAEPAEPTDATGAPDAAATTDATDATGAPDGAEPAEPTDATGAPDAAATTDATDATGASDGAATTDATPEES